MNSGVGFLMEMVLYCKGLSISLISPSGGGRHWSRVNDGSVEDSLEVEMTSYVLLALMSGPQLSRFDLGYSTSIVQWLSQQQNAFGGFASTQVRTFHTFHTKQAEQLNGLLSYKTVVMVTSHSGLRTVNCIRFPW